MTATRAQPKDAAVELAARLAKLAQEDGVLAIRGLQVAMLDAAIALRDYALPRDARTESERNRTIEECAKACEELGPHDRLYTPLECADVVRDLKNAAPQANSDESVAGGGAPSSPAAAAPSDARSAIGHTGETPRTDALTVKLDSRFSTINADLLALARQLERELAAMTKLNRIHVQQLDGRDLRSSSEGSGVSNLTPKGPSGVTYETRSTSERSTEWPNPDDWNLACPKCGASPEGPCGWTSNCPTGLAARSATGTSGDHIAGAKKVEP